MKGLVALGDSITVGEGSMVLGVTPLSWAQWLARALDLPFTSYAVNGARAADVLRDQLPRVRGDYDLACLYAGVNDARSPDFDLDAFERDLLAVAQGLRERSERLLLVTLPLRLGRPTAAPKPAIANGAIRRVARATDAALCQLEDFRGWVEVQPDAVHPTAVGQVVIADRAARALGAPVMPSALAGLPVRRRERLRHLPGHARALLREAVRPVR
jgi:lysophospholipase L1-like esterase